MDSDLLRRANGALCWALTGALTIAVGCGSDDSAPKTFILHGPHGGHLAVMSAGAGFEMEYTLDGPSRRMVIYVQESGGAQPFPLAADSLSGQFVAGAQSVDVTFAADPRPEDPEGQSSRFTLGLDEIPQQLMASEQFVLKLSHSVGGRAITASIAHEGNHGHEYKHD